MASCWCSRATRIHGAVQEDDEEDLKAMEGAGGRALNRADFETDEQFTAYRASREQAPKAAFQFGVKARAARCALLAVTVYMACSRVDACTDS
jgi:RED-like protein C-terminal region